MTSQDFRKAQEALRMKNRELQELFQVSDQTIINWRQGYTRVPQAVALVIRQRLESKENAIH